MERTLSESSSPTQQREQEGCGRRGTLPHPGGFCLPHPGFNILHRFYLSYRLCTCRSRANSATLAPSAKGTPHGRESAADFPVLDPLFHFFLPCSGWLALALIHFFCPHYCSFHVFLLILLAVAVVPKFDFIHLKCRTASFAWKNDCGSRSFWQSLCGRAFPS